MPALRRGRRVSVSELRFQKRVLHKQEERDQRENLHLIRDGVLAGGAAAEDCKAAPTKGVRQARDPRQRR